MARRAIRYHADATPEYRAAYAERFGQPSRSWQREANNQRAILLRRAIETLAEEAAREDSRQ